ncbi:MAG: DNA-formamidopyrimidine glycosylase [Traorella sp.]
MPELPEVETVVRTLEVQLKQATIQDVQILWRNIVVQDLDDFYRIKNQTILKYKRYGKYLIFECEQMSMICHLRMEGKFYILDTNEPYDKHVHVIFKLNNGKYLQYHDTRKFGKMIVLFNEEVDDYFKTKDLGKDAIDPTIDPILLYKKWHPKKIHLKKMLLDQSFLAGIGNIYADEICFATHLDPTSRVYDLSKKDFENIVYQTQRILNGAIQYGGTTIRSYTSSLGVNGLFQLKLKVHQQKECQVCHTPIQKIICDGRGTYRCKKCQKVKRKRG